MKTRIKIAFLMVSLGLTVYFGASIIESIQEQQEYDNALEAEKIAKQEVIAAEKNLAYEYGKCVFYDRTPVEECNRAGPSGLRVYEKYYGNGSWTIGDDPTPQ